MIFYFLIGFISGVVGIPLLGGLADIISTLCEFIKALISIKIVECNVKINKLNNSVDKPTRAIGFATTIEEEEDYE